MYLHKVVLLALIYMFTITSLSAFHSRKRNMEQDDLALKRTVVSSLNYLIRKLRAEEAMHVKRTCAVNLGNNHCLTESLDRATSQYNWLKTHLSPGKRRRRRSHPFLRSDNLT